MSNRRLLIISGTFFPDPMVAALRMTQFARYLPSSGWNVRVLCRHYGHQADAESLARQVHGEVEVVYLSDPAPFPSSQPLQGNRRSLRSRLRSLASWLMFIPDPSIRFWRGALPRVLAEADDFHPDAVLTTSPPFAVHEMGWQLRSRRNIPWVADLREAYLADRRFRPPGVAQLRWPAHRAYERRLYDSADLILHQLPVNHRWARRKYPHALARMHELPNGFAAELIDGSIAPLPPPPGRQSIRVIGTLHDDALLRLAEAVKRLLDRHHDVELCFVGRIPGIAPALRTLLGDRITLTGFVPHERAMAYLLGADLLVNYLEPQRQISAILSTKIIEYLATGKPVLEICPTVSDRLFMSRWPQGRTLERPDTELLADTLWRMLQTHFTPDPKRLADFRMEYEWSQCTRRLVTWLNNLMPIKP